MARGWEGKPVESMSAGELELLRKKESLLLSRARVERELEASGNARHRRLMEKALADLNAGSRGLRKSALGGAP